jgi:16S rRNA (guanine527-N7)-methyltransferase
VKKLLTDGLKQLGITPPEGAMDRMVRYAELLLERNEVMNLTAITEPGDVAALHFLDSAALLGAADFRNKRVVDVGTGAGFPGLVLKILEPSISLTLLDSQGKRVDWLRSVCLELGIGGVELLHARAEEQGLVPGYRDSFDLAASRALANLSLLCELCLPFVKAGGRFLAMKSVGCDEELSKAGSAMKLLGGGAASLYDYGIPGTEIVHRAVIVEKIAPTPRGYPRRWAKMQKAPL